MSPIDRTTLAGRTAEQIKAYIIERGLKPGDRLPTESELTETFKVSRSTVREALKQVQTTGILDVLPGRGACIRPFDIQQAVDSVTWGLHLIGEGDTLRDVFEARYTLEMAILPLVVRNARDDHLDELERWIGEMDLAGDLNERRRAEAMFHRTMIMATRNVLLTKLGVIVLEFFAKLRQVSPERLFPRPSRRLFDHARLLRAIRARDLPGLQSAMEEHFDWYMGHFDVEPWSGSGAAGAAGGQKPAGGARDSER